MSKSSQPELFQPESLKQLSIARINEELSKELLAAIKTKDVERYKQFTASLESFRATFPEIGQLSIAQTNEELGKELLAVIKTNDVEQYNQFMASLGLLRATFPEIEPRLGVASLFSENDKKRVEQSPLIHALSCGSHKVAAEIMLANKVILATKVGRTINPREFDEQIEFDEAIALAIENAIENDDVEQYEKAMASYACAKSTFPRIYFRLVEDLTSRSLLIIAVDKGSGKVAKYILDSGADINETDKHGYTALMEAVSYSKLEMVELLLKYGADIAVRTIHGDTAFRIGETRYNPDGRKILKLLLNRENELKEPPKQKMEVEDAKEKSPTSTRPVFSQSAFGSTPLTLVQAASAGNLQAVQSFLDSGADINETDKDGYTALMEAVSYSKLEMVELLLKYGADIAVSNIHGDTAFRIGEVRTHNPDGRKILKLLLNRENELKEPPKQKMEVEDAKEKSPTSTRPVFSQSAFGSTPLTLVQAASAGNLQAVQSFLDSGVDINETNKNGFTALMKAVSTSKLEMVELLLKYGADIAVSNIHGDTAFKMGERRAGYYSNPGGSKIFELLLNRKNELKEPPEQKLEVEDAKETSSNSEEKLEKETPSPTFTVKVSPTKAGESKTGSQH